MNSKLKRGEEADKLVCGSIGRRRLLLEGTVKSSKNPLYYYTVSNGVIVMVAREDKNWMEREGYYGKRC